MGALRRWTPRVAAAIIAIFAMPAALHATDGGSSYSILGIGDLRYLPSIRSAGMGYTGLGLTSPTTVNVASPAAWSRFTRTHLEFGLVLDGFASTDGTVSRYISNARFTGASLAIPVSQDHGIGAVLGLAPYSSIDYDMSSSTSLVPSTDTISYTLHQSGKGGFGRAFLGTSYSLSNNLTIGASFNFIFGKGTTTIVQTPTEAGYYGGTISDEFRGRGGSVTVAFLFESLGGISETLAPLSIGGTFTTKTSMTGERLSRYQYAAERDTTPEVDVDFTIPMAYGIGLGYRFWDRYQLAIDYTSQPWSTASISGQSWPDIRNGSRLGIGAERDGSRDAQASYLDRAAWRVGFTYTSTYYNPTGTPINEWSVTAGASLPIGLENRIHLAFEYGRRGTLENSLIQDTIYRFSASLAISEMWFIRSEED